MEIPLLEILRQLNLLELLVLGMLGLLMVYWAMTGKVYGLFFLLLFGASLTGSAIPLFENLGSLTRWIAIILLLLSSLYMKRISIPFGSMLFLGYVALGFVFLFFSNSNTWQFQRSALLVIVAVAIPFAYGNQSLKSYRLTLILIGVAATTFSAYHFMSLPGHLGEAARLSGYARNAPWFAMVLGGLLPFSLWAFWATSSLGLRVVLGMGFLLGTITLVFSGQRGGTVMGLLGVTPLLLMNLRKRKTMVWTVVGIILLSWLGFFFFQRSSAERIYFLLSRYNLAAGLSGREAIWEGAMSEINRNLFIGRGTGAAETVVAVSFHNAWLEVWYNTGLPGLVLFVTAQLYFFYRLFLLSRIVEGTEGRAILALALGYNMGFLSSCFIESVGAGASNLNIVLYILLGVLVSSKNLFEPFLHQKDARLEA